MRLILALCLMAAPAMAQETSPAEEPPSREPPSEEGFSLMREGAQMVLRGLMTEVDPALSEMEQALALIGPALEAFGEEVGPRLHELLAVVDDFANYDAPVVLPNGDILIRRKAPRVPVFPDPPAPSGEIEL